MKKLTCLVVTLALFLPSLVWAQSPRVKQRKQNLRELEKKLKVQKERETLLSKELTGRRKELTVSATITHEDLQPLYDAKNKIYGYKFSLRSFFEKIVEQKPKDFFYPLKIISIKLHYEGSAVATIGYGGPKHHARLYSEFKYGDGSYLFPNNPHFYSDSQYVYFETNDKMKTKMTVNYLGIDSIQPEAEQPWVTDLKRIASYREKFYKAIPKVPGQEKEASLFNKLINLIKFIETKYNESGPQVRRLIEQNYRNLWLSKLRKKLEERNRKIERVLQDIDELNDNYKGKRASFQLNELVEKEFALKKQLKDALDTSEIEAYIASIRQEIEKKSK